MRPNKKVEENKSVLELNFTLKCKCAGHNFDVEYLTKPYWTVTLKLEKSHIVGFESIAVKFDDMTT